MPAPARTELLRERQQLTSQLHTSPYDPHLYCNRARLHRQLGYPDLAVGDAYRAVLLVDTVRDALDEEVIDFSDLGTTLSDDLAFEDADFDAAAHVIKYIPSESAFQNLQYSALELLAESLRGVGCTKQANDQLAIINAVSLYKKGDLERVGSSRRVVYPWNKHEPDRFAPEVIQYLNQHVVPRCSTTLKAAVVELPILSSTGVQALGTMKHLGLFATKDIAVGEPCMDEETALTAITDPIDGGLCEYCGTRWKKDVLPSRPTLNLILDKEDGKVASDDEETPAEDEDEEIPETWTCELCEAAEAEGEDDDIIVPVWCSQHCKDSAMAKYHPALCCRPIASLYRGAIANKPPHTYTVRQPGGAAYSLLLLRAFAMALTQNKHPLELDETKYLYGVPPEPEDDIDLMINWTHEENVRDPVRILEALDIDIYTGKRRSRLDGVPYTVEVDGPSLDWWDTWVVNTLIAKFRGVASGRQDSRGRTEAAAAHTIYSLANHSCEPNIEWNCAGRTVFRGIAPLGRPETKIAVREGEELNSCYSNRELDYKERREWMVGCLGGYCMCQRCLREEREDLEWGRNGMENGMEREVHAVEKERKKEKKAEGELKI